MAKGFQALSAILITGIMLGVVGSVYFWGLPLIEKNRDISTLENSERFMKELNSKIVYIANHGGRDRFQISVPGTVKFDSAANAITLEIETKGSIYIPGLIPLGRNSCTIVNGVWGSDESSVLCVDTRQIDDKMQHSYILRFITLDTAGVQSYKIELTGETDTGSEQGTIVIEGKGSSIARENSRDVAKTFVGIVIE